MIKELSQLLRSWMSLLSKSRVNTYVADQVFQRWPHQHSPSHMLSLQWMRHRRSSMKRWGLCPPSPKPWTKGPLQGLNQQNMAGVTLHDFRGNIMSQDGMCLVCTPLLPSTHGFGATLWRWSHHAGETIRRAHIKRWNSPEARHVNGPRSQKIPAPALKAPRPMLGRAKTSYPWWALATLQIRE